MPALLDAGCEDERNTVPALEQHSLAGGKQPWNLKNYIALSDFTELSLSQQKSKNSQQLTWVHLA